jgi:hypothetical protein
VNQIDIFEQAIEAAKDGIRRSVAHAEADCPGWTEIAFQYLVDYAKRHDRFSAWMVNEQSKLDRKVPIPKNEKAWAAPIRRGLKDFVIKKDGFAPNPKRHATESPVYRSLVFRP